RCLAPICKVSVSISLRNSLLHLPPFASRRTGGLRLLMRIGECFSADYVTARGKFRDAAAEAGSAIASHVNPAPSPTGAELVTDTAWLGPERPVRLLIVMSGTHGVEGFCGSGI